MSSKDEALKLIAIHDETGNIEDLVLAYNACKEALKQPTQEPINNCPNCNSWFTKEIHSIPLHQWQELTDDEALQIYIDDPAIAGHEDPHLIKYARAIEQALKEKNT